MSKLKENLKEFLLLQAESYNLGGQKEIMEFFLSKVKHLDIKHYYDAMGNLYITKGSADLYPCIVAHVDQVHDEKQHYDIVESQGFFMGTCIDNKTGLIEQAGTGGKNCPPFK